MLRQNRPRVCADRCDTSAMTSNGDAPGRECIKNGWNELRHSVELLTRCQRTRCCRNAEIKFSGTLSGREMVMKCAHHDAAMSRLSIVLQPTQQGCDHQLVTLMNINEPFLLSRLLDALRALRTLGRCLASRPIGYYNNYTFASDINMLST